VIGLPIYSRTGGGSCHNLDLRYNQIGLRGGVRLLFGHSKKLQDSLTRTRQSFFGQITSLLGTNEITDEMWEELEELLILADVGASTTIEIVEKVRERINREHVLSAEKAKELLKEELKAILDVQGPPIPGRVPLRVFLIVGVNGSGKTTSIAKLAYRYKELLDRKVMLAAADTFRAAAIDQLKLWGERLGVEMISHQPGADPGAVVFDAIQAAQKRNVEVLIIDTAGRLHTKYNLMQELKKVRNVVAKALPGAPHETLLVLDGTTGQNALSQAKHFKEAVEVTGVVISKLDGTAKGGMVFAVTKELGLPIHYVGTGEKMDDFIEFYPEDFIDGLFES
jgi:fused signal recognition particle receptor